MRPRLRSALLFWSRGLKITLGVDPFTAAEEAVFPVTLGDFVKVYENGVH